MGWRIALGCISVVGWGLGREVGLAVVVEGGRSGSSASEPEEAGALGCSEVCGFRSSTSFVAFATCARQISSRVRNRFNIVFSSQEKDRASDVHARS